MFDLFSIQVFITSKLLFSQSVNSAAGRSKPLLGFSTAHICSANTCNNNESSCYHLETLFKKPKTYRHAYVCS